MVTSSMAGWRLLPCFLALDSSSSFPCPAFLAIAKSVVVFLSLSLSIPILDCHHTWCCCGTPSDFYCATQT
ncbi:hypothetical protein STEG23_026378, partial [Scotinomys teguina]